MGEKQSSYYFFAESDEDGILRRRCKFDSFVTLRRHVSSSGDVKTGKLYSHANAGEGEG